MKTRIFLSYGRNDDASFVRRFYDSLKLANFDVWFDRASMPSRQLTFLQEIRDAIAWCDRLVLVIGPDAVQSEYVIQEWHFAYFDAVKCVNPIVRLDGKDVAGNRIDGFTLIPEDLRLVHAEDFRRDEEYERNVENLVRQLREPLPPMARLIGVPELPVHYVPQRKRLHEVRDLLMVDIREPVVITSADRRVGLHGMPGIGKSVLACALAHHPEVQRAFSDGIYWVSLGEKPNVLDRQRWLTRALSGKDDFQSVATGKEILRALLKDTSVLLVLDDIWCREDAEAFIVVGPRGRLLLTTRDAGMVAALTAQENRYSVSLPSKREALSILASAAGKPEEALPPEATRIIWECGRLPLALAICGAMVRAGGSSPAIVWSDLLEALLDHDLRYLSSAHPAEEHHASVWRAINVSLRALPEDQRTRFAELAVFDWHSGTPNAAVETLWEHTAGITAREGRKMLAEFVARSLIEPREHGRLSLHALLYDFALGMALNRFGSTQILHRLLLDAYERKCVSGWPSGPDDGYFLEHLCYHFIEAGRIDEAVLLLDGLAWVEAKCRAGLAFGLQEDYQRTIEFFPEAHRELSEERHRDDLILEWVDAITKYASSWSTRRDALRRGEDVREPAPRVPQPVPSVQPWTDGQPETESAHIPGKSPALERLRAFALFVATELHALAKFGSQPGLVFQEAYNFSRDSVVSRSAAVLLERASVPVLLKAPETRPRYNPHPPLIRTIEGGQQLWALDVSPDGRIAVAGGDKGVLNIWDLAAGRLVKAHKIAGDRIAAVRLLPNCKSVVLTGQERGGNMDSILRVIDIESGRCSLSLDRPFGELGCLAVTPDGRMALTGGGSHVTRDYRLYIWDLVTGKCLTTLDGHPGFLTEAVAISSNGCTAVSGSGWFTGQLKVWNIQTGKCVLTRAGHKDAVEAVCITEDGQLAISAGHDATIRVWEIRTGRCRRILKGHEHPVTSLSLSADGKLAASASWDRSVRVWDIQTGLCLRTFLGHTDNIYSVQLTADGRFAVSGAGLGDHTLRLWDVTRGTSVGAIVGHLGQRTNAVDCIAVAPSAHLAVSGSRDTTLGIWDSRTGRLGTNLKGHENWVHCVDVTTDGTLAVSGSSDRTLRVWDVGTSSQIRTVRCPAGESESVRFVPNTTVVLSCGGGRQFMPGQDGVHGWLQLWDAKTGAVVQTLAVRSLRVSVAVLSPDSRLALSGDYNGNTNVWDLKSGKGFTLKNSANHCGWIQAAEWSPDGLLVMSAGGGGYVSIQALDFCIRGWTCSTRKLVLELRGHRDTIVAIKVTPDGTRLVSGDEDGVVHLWDLVSGQCLQSLRLSRISCLTLSTDGRLALIASYDNAVRVWDLRTGEVIAIFCADSIVRALSELTPGGVFACGGDSGAVTFLRLSGIDFGPPIITAVRQWTWRADLKTCSWDDYVTACCGYCGRRFRPADSVLSAIEAANQQSGAQVERSRNLSLAPDCWDWSELVSECPNCRASNRFNPFVVDNKSREGRSC